MQTEHTILAARQLFQKLVAMWLLYRVHFT